MAPFSAFVLYAVIWFLTLFLVLPLRLTTQAEAGSVVPGTPPGAPAQAGMRRRLWVTTLVSLAVWAVVVGVVLSGVITVADLDALYAR